MMYTDTLMVPFTLYDCCGHSGTLAPVVYRVEITQGKEWCSFYDPISGARDTIIDSLKAPNGCSSFYIEAIGQAPDEPSEAHQVSLTVSSYGDIVPPLALDFFVTPFQGTLLTTPGRNGISYGDTTSLTLSMTDTLGDPIGEILNVQYSIIKGNAYSTLQSLDSTEIGETIEGVFQSAILRTVDVGNAPDSLTVLIKTIATVPCPECGAVGIIASKDSSKDKRKDVADIRKELLSQRMHQISPTLQTNLQSAMQMKSNENPSQTTSSQKAPGKITPISKTTKSSPPHQRKIQYDGYTKNLYGLTKVTVKKPVLKIHDHSPWTIWPYLPPQNDGSSRGADRPGYNPKRTFTIQVLKGDGTPFPDQQITIFTKYEEGSGGHGHTGYADTRGTFPAEKSLNPILQGLFYYKGGKGENPLTMTTDAKGSAVVDSFIASQASGKFLITARMESDTTIMDTVNLQVKVPGLVELGTGDYYWTLTGFTNPQGSNHLRNHWCTQKMKDSLSAAIKDFYNWSGSEEGENEFIKLGINDMCLEWGGAFDFPGKWIFIKDHSFHRVGLSVDIDNYLGYLRKADGTLTDKGEQLKVFMEKYGGQKYNKEKPIHFGFDGEI